MAEPRRESGLSKALNAAWVRPFLFLIFIVVMWDLTIRLFRIPAYQIPAPGDVVAQVACGVAVETDWTLSVFGTAGRIEVPKAWIPAREGGARRPRRWLWGGISRQ